MFFSMAMAGRVLSTSEWVSVRDAVYGGLPTVSSLSQNWTPHQYDCWPLEDYLYGDKWVCTTNKGEEKLKFSLSDADLIRMYLDNHLVDVTVQMPLGMPYEYTSSAAMAEHLYRFYTQRNVSSVYICPSIVVSRDDADVNLFCRERGQDPNARYYE